MQPAASNGSSRSPDWLTISAPLSLTKLAKDKVTRIFKSLKQYPARIRFNKQEMSYQKYFKWLFLVEHSSLSPGVNIRFGSRVKPAPCRIPCPVCDTSSIAPPNGLVTTPIRPLPTPVMTPLAASLTSLARRIPWMG